MKTETIPTNEMTPRPFLRRLANETTHNLTSAVSASTVAITHDHKEVTMKTQITTHRVSGVVISSMATHLLTWCRHGS
jgi:hypothetical protein